jgi:hypothetical protein
VDPSTARSTPAGGTGRIRAMAGDLSILMLRTLVRRRLT